MVAHPRAPVRTDRLRALNLPRPVAVEVDTQGRPTAIAELGKRETGNGKRATEDPIQDRAPHAVTDILEEWHLDDEWWRVPIHRRCFEVVLEGGAHMVVFQDRTTDAWYLQRP